MEKSSSQILDHFYSLLMEINFHRPEEDVFEENSYKDDPFVEKHLRQIRLRMAKYKAQQNKGGFNALMDEIKRLRSLGSQELDKLLNPEQRLQLQPLFRKFEDLSQEDEASIANDAELLQLIAALKDKLDSSEKDNNNE